MVNVGLAPHEKLMASQRVSEERLAEHKRLMEEGGIEAVVEAIRREEKEAA